MPITHDSITAAFAPLSTENHMLFFATSVSPDVVWQYGAPGATHPLAGRYDGMPAFVAGTFAKLGGCFAGELLSSPNLRACGFAVYISLDPLTSSPLRHI